MKAGNFPLGPTGSFCLGIATKNRRNEGHQRSQGSLKYLNLKRQCDSRANPPGQGAAITSSDRGFHSKVIPTFDTRRWGRRHRKDYSGSVVGGGKTGGKNASAVGRINCRGN